MLPRRSDQQHRETPRGGAAGSSPTPPDEQALLFELWQISHFGWISETAIRRSLRIAGGREISAAALTECLGRLLDRGWVEQRDNDPDTGGREWRLTDSGRGAR
jgi:hypothetical protein